MEGQYTQRQTPATMVQQQTRLALLLPGIIYTLEASGGFRRLPEAVWLITLGPLAVSGDPAM